MKANIFAILLLILVSLLMEACAPQQLKNSEYLSIYNFYSDSWHETPFVQAILIAVLWSTIIAFEIALIIAPVCFIYNAFKHGIGEGWKENAEDFF